MEEARKLIEDLTDPDDCQYDHNNLCQTHGCDERPCAHERAKQWLTKPRYLTPDPNQPISRLRTCARDHCTPEERAVIEAALELSKGFFRTGDSIWRGPLYSNEAEDRFVTAAWQLLAARARREKE